jgi:hypothetical protein
MDEALRQPGEGAAQTRTDESVASPSRHRDDLQVLGMALGILVILVVVVVTFSSVPPIGG